MVIIDTEIYSAFTQLLCTQQAMSLVARVGDLRFSSQGSKGRLPPSLLLRLQRQPAIFAKVKP